METDDFLADKVQVSRPEFVEFFRVVQIADWCQVVRESIKPYVNNVFRVNRHRNAPVERGAGNAQIIKTLFNEVNHFIAARYWLNKIRMFFDILKQAVGIFGNFEEIRFFGYFLDFTAAIRTFAVHELAFQPEAFTRRTVQTFVCSFIDVAFFVNAAENFLHNFFMTRLRCADEIVVGDVEHFPEVLETGNDFVYVFNRRNTLFLRFLFDFLSVLVGTCQEKYVEVG